MELYERRQEEKIGGQDICYILPLFLGSTTIQWARKVFLNTKNWLRLPVKVLKCVSRSWVYISKFGI